MKRRIFLLVLILSLGLSAMSGTVRQVPDEGEIIPVKFKPKRTIDDKKMLVVTLMDGMEILVVLRTETGLCLRKIEQRKLAWDCKSF